MVRIVRFHRKNTGSNPVGIKKQKNVNCKPINTSQKNEKKK